jgi:hypothetical protein
VTINNACPNPPKDAIPCERFFGVWIVTNRNLLKIITDEGKKMRLLTLRTIAFSILMIGNAMALYISGRFKKRYPQ